MREAPKVFRKSFTHQEPISETAITRATEVLRLGKLHRYNVDSGETSEVSMLEAEFAAYMGMRYCLACASCGSAMYLALKSAGVQPGDAILCNAFTLAPVPGMIENAGGRIVLVRSAPATRSTCMTWKRRPGATGPNGFFSPTCGDTSPIWTRSPPSAASTAWL